MKSRGFRRFVFLFSLALAAGPLAASSRPAGSEELDSLSREVRAFAAAPAPAGSKSLELAQRIGWSEASARHERDPAKREALLARLDGLRRQLASAAPAPAAGDGGGGDKANGAFSGRVTDDGEPVPGTRIEIYDENSYYRESVYSGADGRYTLSREPGTYFLYAVAPYDRPLSPQLFQGISCFLSSTCQPTDGTPLTIASGGHRTADFALQDLGTIEGQVRRRGDAAPIETEIRIYDTERNFLTSASSPAGSYRLGGIPPGDYWLVALGTGDLAGRIYGGAACDASPYNYPLTCPTAGAARIRIELDQVAAGIDFELARGASLRASVFDARSGTPIEGGGDFYTIDAAGNQVKRAYLPGDGREVLIEGLAGGVYHASVEAYRYTSQFFDRRDCVSSYGCQAAATPIAVALGEESDLLLFPLNRRGSVAGRVTDDRTGAAIENARLSLIEPASGNSVQTAYSDSAGFFSFSEVPAVSFHLLAEHDRYRGEYFDDVDARRGAAAATPLPVRPGELTTVAIGLEPRGGLAVRALAAETGQPLGCFSVTAYPVDPTPQTFQSFDCPQQGWLTLPNLPPGGYRVIVSASGRALHLVGHGSCNWTDDMACNLAPGAVVQVRSGETADLGEAALELSAAVRAEIRFTAPAGNPHPVLARLLLYDAGGVLVRSSYAYPSQIFHFGGLVPGDYYLVADGSPHWQSVAYPDALCGRWYCDPFRGARIRLDPGEESDTAVFQLGPSAPYSGCTASEKALCLNQGRYEVSATWRDFAGASGAGAARALSADSGYFYFFSPNNLEVLVKVLNGCAPHLGHHFWVYGAGLTNVQVQLRVKDTLTGAVELYSNALGSTFQPILDNAAFATCDAIVPAAPAGGVAAEGAPSEAAAARATAPGPLADPSSGAELCSDAGDFCLGGRFAVAATYRTPGGSTGQAGATRVTPDTGTFTFFDTSNVELVVKILDACDSALPGYWVFASGLTDVEVSLEITDRGTGRSKTYHQPPGPFVPVIDLQSFPCE